MSPPDATRFLALLHTHRAILYKVAFGYCRGREDRADLIQEMAIQLWRSFGRYDDRLKFSTWAYRVAMNVAISHFRGERRRIRDTLPFDEFAEELAAHDPLAEEAGDNMRVLRQLIDGLDELNRALVLLRRDPHGPPFKLTCRLHRAKSVARTYPPALPGRQPQGAGSGR